MKSAILFQAVGNWLLPGLHSTLCPKKCPPFYFSVKWLQYTDEVGKCTSYRCQIFSGFSTPKIIQIG